MSMTLGGAAGGGGPMGPVAQVGGGSLFGNLHGESRAL